MGCGSTGKTREGIACVPGAAHRPQAVRCQSGETVHLASGISLCRKGDL